MLQSGELLQTQTSEQAGDHSLPFQFSFGPFRFFSQFDIPELHRVADQPVSERPAVAVRIRLGRTPGELAGAKTYGRWCYVAPTEYLLRIPDVASFYVAGGQSVTVQIAENAPAADVSTYLLGSVFGALCHQNGLLPLHASAVEDRGQVTAFLGDSGAGKSTMAACLQGRGHRIISDDICVLQDAGPAGAMRVIPVAGWLKLWRASLNHLGEAADERNRVYSADDKFRLYLEAAASERPALANLVFLARGSGETPRLEPLSTIETITRMMELTYLGYITELTGSHSRVFRQCASVLRDASGFRLTVPWGFNRIEAVLDLLERELLAPMTPQ